jgi:CO dehydrogenase nickel-insertion accessory protein CooC1
LLTLTGRQRRNAIELTLRQPAHRGQVIAVLGMAGSGRSTLAALLTMVTAMRQRGPVLAVDCSGSLWPGLARRLPVPPNLELDWQHLAPAFTSLDDTAAARVIAERIPQVNLRTSQAQVGRLGGAPYGQPNPPPPANATVRTIEIARRLGRYTFVDSAAETHWQGQLTAVTADALVVTCRADASELRRAARLVRLLSAVNKRDFTSITVITAIDHRGRRWSRATAAAIAAASEAAAAVMRIPYDPALADSSSPVFRAGAATTDAAAHIAAVAAHLSLNRAERSTT